MSFFNNLWHVLASLRRRPIDTIRTGLTPVTDDRIFDRWKKKENLLEEWDGRTKLIADLIPSGSDVIEFGAGRMVLEGMLAGASSYQPSDIVARNDKTMVCDLNRDTIVLSKRYSHAVFSGVLEYVRSIPQLIENISTNVDIIVASYSAVDSLPDLVLRRKNGWVSNLTEAEFLDAFSTNGFEIKQVAKWREQSIYVFEKSSARH